MIRTIEALGDRLLGAVVPQVTAKAERDCECLGMGGHWFTEDCFCSCGGGSAGIMVKRDCRCDGCHWNCGTCHSSWWPCWCP